MCLEKYFHQRPGDVIPEIYTKMTLRLSLLLTLLPCFLDLKQVENQTKYQLVWLSWRIMCHSLDTGGSK